MIETLLALVPTYGVWLIMACVAFSCLAMPVPSSMLVMAAGGFAATGDLNYTELVTFAFIGFMIGDQVAYCLARKGGTALITRMQSRPKAAAIISKAEKLVNRHGVFAVILSRTILSPIGPYVAFISGALKLEWLSFTSAAAFGALIWCVAYSWLGYAFASSIAEIAALIASSVGIIIAAAVVFGLLWFLIQNYRIHNNHDRKSK